MHKLEQYDVIDITQQIINTRNALGIPDEVRIGGVDYKIHRPKQVVVFANPSHLHSFTVDQWIKAASDFSGGHIISTGETFEPVYDEAARRKSELSPHLTRIDISNLDEVWPIKEGDPNIPLTYIVYRNIRVVKPLGLSEGQCIIPDGNTENPQEEVVLFEGKLADRTWDFAMMGIGPDEKTVGGRIIPASPHIGFIPRGTLPEQTAMLVKLDEGTIYANSRGAPDPDHFFTHAITQGPGDIKRAKRHLLVATGTHKKQNIRDVLLGCVNIHIPATQVLLYPETTVVLDTQSAKLVQTQIEDLPQKHSFPVT